MNKSKYEDLFHTFGYIVFFCDFIVGFTPFLVSSEMKTTVMLPDL